MFSLPVDLLIATKVQFLQYYKLLIMFIDLLAMPLRSLNIYFYHQNSFQINCIYCIFPLNSLFHRFQLPILSVFNLLNLSK